MRFCPQCGTQSETDGACQRDGQPLQPADGLLGATLGSYLLVELLGEGGMGEVYRAVHPAIGALVAIKVLSPVSAADRDLVRRFFAEAETVNRIRHKNIVQVVDLGETDDGRPFIIMEYLDGASLGTIMKSGEGVPLATLSRCLVEVLAALDAAHRLGVVHRDLKPDNIFMTRDGTTKVLDFGVAKLLDRQRPEVATQSDVLLGTPPYMSPEQALSAPIDGRSDLYSLGVVLYEAITGRRPFIADSLFSLLRKHIEEAPRPPRELAPGLPPAFEAVVLKALAKEPDDRYPDAPSFAADLSAAAAQLPADANRPLTTPPPSGRVLIGTETRTAPAMAGRAAGGGACATGSGVVARDKLQPATVASRPVGRPTVDMRPPSMNSRSEAADLRSRRIPPTLEPEIDRPPSRMAPAPDALGDRDESHSAATRHEPGRSHRWAIVAAILFLGVAAASVLVATTVGGDGTVSSGDNTAVAARSTRDFDAATASGAADAAATAVVPADAGAGGEGSDGIAGQTGGTHTGSSSASHAGQTSGSSHTSTSGGSHGGSSGGAGPLQTEHKPDAGAVTDVETETAGDHEPAGDKVPRDLTGPDVKPMSSTLDGQHCFWQEFPVYQVADGEGGWSELYKANPHEDGEMAECQLPPRKKRWAALERDVEAMFTSRQKSRGKDWGSRDAVFAISDWDVKYAANGAPETRYQVIRYVTDRKDRLWDCAKGDCSGGTPRTSSSN